MKCQKYPTCAIILKRGLFKDIKSFIPMCQMHKYKNTNTQKQHMTKYQKDPTCGIFLKRGLFRDTNYDVHMSQTRKYKNRNTQRHKYTNTNTAYDKVPDRPNV